MPSRQSPGVWSSSTSVELAFTPRSWEHYYLPGTLVLRNRFGETDAVALAAKEEFASAARSVELAAHPIRGAFNYAHMKAIHRHLFQDVYDWAGRERVGPVGRMTKDGPDVVNFVPGDPDAPLVSYAYYPAAAIAAAAHGQYELLATENHLLGLRRPAFVERLAEHWGEINAIHAFREGNTRAQFVFFSQLTEHAGFRLEARQFAQGSPLREEFVLARFHHQATTSTARLASVLDRAISVPLNR